MLFICACKKGYNNLTRNIDIICKNFCIEVKILWNFCFHVVNLSVRLQVCSIHSQLHLDFIIIVYFFFLHKTDYLQRTLALCVKKIKTLSRTLIIYFRYNVPSYLHSYIYINYIPKILKVLFYTILSTEYSYTYLRFTNCFTRAQILLNFLRFAFITKRK